LLCVTKHNITGALIVWKIYRLPFLTTVWCNYLGNRKRKSDRPTD